MKKVIFGTLMAGMISTAVASENTINYSMTVTLESSQSSSLIESIGNAEKNSAVISEMPITKMRDYEFATQISDEKYMPSGCEKKDGAININPGAEPMIANFRVNGEWERVEGSEGVSIFLQNRFKLEVYDISGIHLLGKVDDSCEVESATQKSVSAYGTLDFKLGENEVQRYVLGNGYTLKFEIKGQ